MKHRQMISFNNLKSGNLLSGKLIRNWRFDMDLVYVKFHDGSVEAFLPQRNN